MTTWEEFKTINHPRSGARDRVYSVHWNALLDHGLEKAATYVIRRTSSRYEAINGSTGKVDYSSDDLDDASEVLGSVIEDAGLILFKEGTYKFGSSVAINKSGVMISGIASGGDLYFTNDTTYHGQSDKMGTLIVADGINAFEIGESSFIQGVGIENLFISGVDSDAKQSDTTYSSGAGIKVWRVSLLRIRNVQVRHKEYGVVLDTTPLGSFSYDKVIDLPILENIMLAYNVHGIYARGFVDQARFRNIAGYINQKNLLDMVLKYDNVIENVWSNADAFQSSTQDEAPIAVYSPSDVRLINISVYGAYGTTLCPVPLLYLAPQKSANGTEHYRGHFTLENLTLFETQSDAIRVPSGCYGIIEISSLHAGSSGDEGYAGGAGTITGSVIENKSEDGVVIFVRGGYVKSGQSKRYWFNKIRHGRIEDVNNFNPYGVISNPFENTENTVGLYDPSGTASATPNANVDYEVVSTDVMITATGGSGVSITIKDVDGNTVASGLSSISALYLPVGYKINFGSFSSAPSVTVAAV